MPQGSLFTRDFLDRGITETADWRALDNAEVTALREAFRERIEALRAGAAPTEHGRLWRLYFQGARSVSSA